MRARTWAVIATLMLLGGTACTATQVATPTPRPSRPTSTAPLRADSVVEVQLTHGAGDPANYAHQGDIVRIANGAPCRVWNLAPRMRGAGFFAFRLLVADTQRVQVLQALEAYRNVTTRTLPATAFGVAPNPLPQGTPGVGAPIGGTSCSG